MQIGNIVNSVMGMVGKVGDISSHSTASKGVDLFNAVGDLFSGGKTNATEVGGVIGGFMETVGSLGQFGLGGQVNNLVDSLGLPDWIGDIGGGVADFMTGNFIGAAANGMDLMGDVVKGAGQLIDKIGQSKTDGYVEASGQVQGMYNDPPSVSSEQVESAPAACEQTAQSIDTGREACACYNEGKTVEAGKKAVESTRQSVCADAAAHPEVSEADVQTTHDTMSAIEDAFSTFELADDKEAALEHIRQEHGDEIASLVERFADGSGDEQGQDNSFLGMLGGLGKALASTVGQAVNGPAADILGELTQSHMDVLGMIDQGAPALDGLEDIFQSAGGGDIASRIGADQGASIRM